LSHTESLFLVSGGSGGIGSAVCHQLANSGYRPVVAYRRNEEAARAIAAQCGGGVLHLDLASESSILEAVDKLEAAALPLAGVVLAGSPPPVLSPFGKIARDEMLQQWLVHVLGPQQLLAQLVRRCFRKTMQGSVIGVLSMAMGGDGRRASSGMGAYVIGKYGLAGVLAILEADYPWLNVRTVKPGYTETPMLQAFDERFLALQRDREPFRTADEVAADILREVIAA
jgi:NAD(P)-dependent dehydrogenase (short-subunit alcohol dehydrogenase family)